MIAKFRENLFVKKGYTWNPATYSCENGRYERSIFGDLAIICYAIIGTTKGILTKTVQVKSIPPNLKEKKTIPNILPFLHFTCLFINFHNNY